MKRAGERILSFGLAGIAGFAVDAGVLALAIGWAGPWWGRAASFTCAVLTTWALNRRTTFHDRPSRYSLAGELGRYFAAMCMGGATNYAVYAAALGVAGQGGLAPFAALAAGSLAGMAINLTLAHYAVFGP